MNEPGHLVPPTVRARARPGSRFPFAFGRRFFLLLLIGLVWLGPAWSDKRYLYAMFLWDIGVVLLWLWDLANIPKPEQLEVRRIWGASVQLSVQTEVKLEIQNRGKSPLLTEILDDVPQSFRGDAPEVTVSVPAGETGSATYSVQPRERGDARVGCVFLRCQSPWRIAERWACAALNQAVRIYPNIEESKRDTIYLIRSRQVALQARHKHFRGQGREFESLREYREGDEWRNICWSAVARRGKLITKTHQFERSQTVWLVLDTGRLLRTRVRGLTKLDYAVGAALALAQVALYSGDRVALLAYGRRVQQRLPAGRGPAHVRTLIEELAQVHSEEFEADHSRAAEVLLSTQKRRGLVVWFTDLAETAAMPDVIESASRLARRHLVLLTVISQPELRGLLESRPESNSEMYHYVAAQEIVHRREVLLRTLRQCGALTLEIEPATLSSAVVNQYLLAKERGMI
ncbi:MAG TPA: DUF58 domain-containing protein [Candidatus Acidoferrales bacterium]|nr:DUF58 domain-containing protein [Candidatus Acidoferrales bacterium]